MKKNNNIEAIQHISSPAFSYIKITTTWNALPYDVVSSRTAVNTHIVEPLGQTL